MLTQSSNDSESCGLFWSSNSKSSDCINSFYNEEYRFIQPFWDYLRFEWGNWIQSPLFPPFYALSIDYIYVAIFIVLDLGFANWDFVQKYKIQKEQKVTWKLVKETLKHQLFNQVVWIYPAALAQLLYIDNLVLPRLAPTVWQVIWQVMACFLLFDAGYFLFHLTMHKVRFLYRWCHSVHHMYSSPFAAAAQHLHPFELFFIGTYVTTVPWLFDTHPLCYWLWFAVAQCVSYEVFSISFL